MRFCPKCRKRQADSSEFCPTCGSPLVLGSLESTSPLAETSRNVGRRLRRVGLLVAIGIIVATLLFAFILRSSLLVQSSQEANITVEKESIELVTTEGRQAETAKLLVGTRVVVRVLRDGFKPVEIKARAGFGPGKTLVPIQLEPDTVDVVVSSEPSGADFTFTNNYEQRSCKAPCTLEKTFVMKTRVEATLSGFRPYRSDFLPRSGVPHDVRVRFNGRLDVSSTPGGAQILVDSAPTGRYTPATLIDIPARGVKVTLRKDGFADWTTTIGVDPESVAKVGPAELQTIEEGRGEVFRTGRLMWLASRIPVPEGGCSKARPMCENQHVGPWRWRLPSRSELGKIPSERMKPGCYATNQLDGCEVVCTRGYCCFGFAWCVAERE